MRTKKVIGVGAALAPTGALIRLPVGATSAASAASATSAGARSAGAGPSSGGHRGRSASAPLTLSSCRQFGACLPLAGVPGRAQSTVALTVAFSGTSIGVTQW